MAIVRSILGWLAKLVDMSSETIDTTDYVAWLEQEFEIRFDDEAAYLKTLGDLCDYISNLQAAQGRTPDPDRIWSKVKLITGQEMGVDRSELTPQIRFHEDLCI